jgi:hypothetical protein
LNIRFLGTNLWVSGPGIYESHDGGLTWKRVFSSPVVALEPAGTTAWAVADCTIADPSTSWVLFASPIGSDVWSRSAVQPPVSAAVYGGPEWAPVLLERAPHGVAFLAGASPQPGSQAWLAITRDDGGTWHKSLLPCTFGIAGLRSPDGTTVWPLCGGGGGAGTGPKAVYVSFDGAKSWSGPIICPTRRWAAFPGPVMPAAWRLPVVGSRSSARRERASFEASTEGAHGTTLVQTPRVF